MDLRTAEANGISQKEGEREREREGGKEREREGKPTEFMGRGWGRLSGKEGTPHHPRPTSSHIGEGCLSPFVEGPRRVCLNCRHHWFLTLNGWSLTGPGWRRKGRADSFD